MLQTLGFEGVQISFYWQAHKQMISQLLRTDRMSLYVDPRIARIHKLFAPMDILKQKLSKFGSRDILICDNVLGSGSPTPPGVEFWRIKIRFYPPGHQKNEKRTTTPDAGSSFYYVETVSYTHLTLPTTPYV